MSKADAFSTTPVTADEIDAITSTWGSRRSELFFAEANNYVSAAAARRAGRIIQRLRDEMRDLVEQACSVSLHVPGAREALERFADEIALRSDGRVDAELEIIEHRLAAQARKGKAPPLSANVIVLDHYREGRP